MRQRRLTRFTMLRLGASCVAAAALFVIPGTSSGSATPLRPTTSARYHAYQARCGDFRGERVVSTTTSPPIRTAAESAR